MPGTLTVTPSPAPAGSTVNVSGVRFQSYPLRLYLDARLVVELYPSGGAFTTPVAVGTAIGTRTIAADQLKGNRWRAVTSTTFQVVPATGSVAVTPSVKALTMTRATPTVTATTSSSPTPVTVSPTVRALSIARKTPTVTASSTLASVRVTSIASLKSYLLDNTLDEIVVANGTYNLSSAGQQTTNSLWIGSLYASRTRPITIRAESPGGVTFSGGAATSWGGLWFEEGSHHQTWDGFRFDNGQPTQTGVIVFGGYTGRALPHHITLRNITMMGGLTGTTNGDHCMYFSTGAGTDHVVEDYTVTPGAGIKSALQFFHPDNVERLTVRRMHVRGTSDTILIYESSARDITIEDVDIAGSATPLNVATCGPNVVLRRVVSTTGRQPAFPNGQPAGLSLIDCSFN
jgi:hypothetical protein